MRRRLIVAAVVVAGAASAFVIPQAAQAKTTASAPVCVLGVYVGVGNKPLIPQTNICLP
jgi:hypothetical protein